MLTSCTASTLKFLNAPGYKPDSRVKPVVELFKDLTSRTSNGTQTFEPTTLQFLAFDELLEHLEERGNGRNQGWVKIKIPDGWFDVVLSVFEARQLTLCSIYPEQKHFPIGYDKYEEAWTKTHRVLLPRIPLHPKYGNEGTFKVKYSTNPIDFKADSWNACRNYYFGAPVSSSPSFASDSGEESDEVSSFGVDWPENEFIEQAKYNVSQHAQINYAMNLPGKSQCCYTLV